MQARYQFSDTREDEYTLSLNRFYLLDDEDNYLQYADNHTWSNMAQGRVTWTEPLGNVQKGNFLTVAYRAQYQWNNADKYTYSVPDAETINRVSNTFLLDPNGFKFPILNDLVIDSTLSNRFRNDMFTQDIRLGYKKVSKAYTLDAGLSFVPTMSKSDNLINEAKDIPERWVWNFAPFLR